MTSLLGAKKRAEEFATAVDGTTRQSELPSELVDLIDVVGALRAHAGPTPRPEFSASLRERLMAEAEATLAKDRVLTLPARRHGTRERRLALAASAFVLVGGSAGMAAAAQNSLPGDALYPIKRGLENAQTDLSSNPASQGQDLLAQADSRLSEVRGLLAGSSDLHQLPATLHDFTVQAQQGSDLLLQTYQQKQDPALVDSVRRFTTNGIAALQQAAKTAPSDQQAELTRAAVALVNIDQRATDACPSCAADKPAIEVPPMFLTAAEVDRALTAVRKVQVDNSHPALSEPTPSKPRITTQTVTSTPQPPTSSSIPKTGTGSQPPKTGTGLPGKVKAGTGATLGGLGKAGKGATGSLKDGVKGILGDLLP